MTTTSPVPPIEQLRAVPQVVSIVIPCRNGGPFIGDQLDAIERERRSNVEVGLEVIVVDNGSTDDTADVVRSRMADRPYLRIADGFRATNVSQVRNIGTAVSTGSYVFWLDADDIVQEGWLAAMLVAATRYDSVGGHIDDALLNPDVVRSWRPNLLTARGLPEPFGVLPAPIGCNCGASREAWEAVGGFDDSWGYGGEEVDFFWRLQLAGKSLGYVPDAVVAYRYRTTVRGVFHQAVNYGEGNARLAAQHPDLRIPRLAPNLGRSLVGIAGQAVRSTYSLRARGQLGYNAGHLWGQLKGSVKHRRLRLG
jgi:glycosyltransferase involved in cell wall biosynthesis